MEVRQARVMARTLLDELGVKDFTLVIDKRATRRLGQCRWSEKEIGLSLSLITLNEWAVVDQVVRHEAAHALVGEGYGHGPVWRRKALECGVRNPSSKNTEAAVAPLPIVGTCPIHGEVSSRSRMPKLYHTYTHRGCGEVITYRRRSDGHTD